MTVFQWNLIYRSGPQAIWSLCCLLIPALYSNDFTSGKTVIKRKSEISKKKMGTVVSNGFLKCENMETIQIFNNK